jgi:hypothetical protein
VPRITIRAAASSPASDSEAAGKAKRDCCAASCSGVTCMRDLFLPGCAAPGVCSCIR